MSQNISDNIFVEKFKELSELYFDVKAKIILAEEVYELFPVTLTNEVRNSYDHIFRIFSDNRLDSPQDVEKQFVSASRHLKRAGYDACELIIGGYIAQIKQILNRYSFEQLNQVFGDKYSEIKIFINDVHSNYLVEARSKKNLKTQIEDDIEIDGLYPQFSSIIEKVKAVWEDTINHEPLLEECKKSLNRKSLKNIALNIILLLIGGIITYLFTSN